MTSLLESLPLKVWRELHDPQVAWQAAALCLSLGLALAFSWFVRRRLAAAGGGCEEGAAGLAHRLAFPLAALVLVLAARWALVGQHGVSLLRIAVPLLTALAIIRGCAYMLRLALPAGGLLPVFERALGWTVWSGFALHVLGVAPAIVDYFDEISFHLGRQRFSLLSIGEALLWIVLALLVTLWFARLAEDRLARAQGLEPTLRVMLSKLLRPLLVLVAMLVVLPAVGIDLTALSVFGGALGVGLGFGLQKIASNYVSGFIIVLDRSVRIGDVVTIEKNTGQLTRMTSRYVVVRSSDGTEAIIPNETVITSTVINHSYSDPRVCVTVPVQIGHEADLDAATDLLLAAAGTHPRALAEPAPRVAITALGENGISLELGVWISDPEAGGGPLRSDIYRTVRREFAARGIALARPQREVRLHGDADAPR